jgi:HlyD family secretion protein
MAWSGRARVLMAVAVLAVGGLGVSLWSMRDTTPGVETVVVKRGNYTDVVEIRGDVRPVKSIVVFAPPNAGELVILKLAKNGEAVKKGDVVAQFDAITLTRQLQDKQSELRTVLAELEQAKVTSANQLKDRESAVIRTSYDVDRARLALGTIELVAQVEGARAKLALADAEQRLKEVKASVESTKAGIEADFRARDRRIAKVKADLERLTLAKEALTMTAPADGVVSIMQNTRFFSPMGVPQEYRTGDRTYSGAGVLELPDLSGVFLVARIDEVDRGRIRQGQSAVLRADAVAVREYEGTVSDISYLAKPDYSSWPPSKMFDLKISLKDPDEKLRPGMSAVARIAVGSLPNVLLVPVGTVFKGNDGGDIVFRLSGRRFESVPVQVVRRGREQAAIQSGLNEGDRIAVTRPDGLGQKGSK